MEGCHPGYWYDKATNSCTCDIERSSIVRCDDNNRYVYLTVSQFIYIESNIVHTWFIIVIQEGIWGGVKVQDGRRTLITARVQPGFITCHREGRLPGCKFQFDRTDHQCRRGRKGKPNSMYCA